MRYQHCPLARDASSRAPWREVFAEQDEKIEKATDAATLVNEALNMPDVWFDPHNREVTAIRVSGTPYLRQTKDTITS